MKTAPYLLAAAVLFPGILRAEPEIKGTADELAKYIAAAPRTVMVTGEAEVRLPASRAVVSLAIVTENRSLADALRLNTEIRAGITADLTQQGIPADRIQAAKFSSTPKFGLWGDKAKSYRVENILRVSVQDEKEMRVAARAVDTHPEANFAGVEFEYDEQEAAKSKAIAAACDNAQARKKIYEDRLGIRLRPVRFTDGPVVEKEKEPAVLPRKSYGEFRASSLAPAAPVQEAASAFGEMVYMARVTVEYQNP